MRTEVRGGVLEDDERGPYRDSGADDFARDDGMRAHARWRRRGAAVAITDAGALLRRPVMIVGGRVPGERRCVCVRGLDRVLPAVVTGGVVSSRVGVRLRRSDRDGDGRYGRRLGVRKSRSGVRQRMDLDPRHPAHREEDEAGHRRAKPGY